MSEKYEKEIEEILRKMSFSAPKRKRQSSGWMTSLGSAWQQQIAVLSPTRLFALGMMLALVGYFAREIVPDLAAPLSLLALVLLLGGLGLSMSRQSGRRPTGWRGRAIDYPSSSVDVWASLKRRWEQWRRDRGWNNQRWR